MKTLAKIIETLKGQVQTNGNQNVKALDALISGYTGNDWESYLEFENGRLKNKVLYQDQYVKLVLICWQHRQKSNKHGHPAGGGLIRVLSGSLLEVRFDPKDQELETGRYRHTAGGAVAYIHDSEAVHTVENASEGLSVSLHLYSYGKSLLAGQFDSLEQSAPPAERSRRAA